MKQIQDGWYIGITISYISGHKEELTISGKPFDTFEAAAGGLKTDIPSLVNFFAKATTVQFPTLKGFAVIRPATVQSALHYVVNVKDGKVTETKYPLISMND